jgi:hypothetical protein
LKDRKNVLKQPSQHIDRRGAYPYSKKEEVHEDRVRRPQPGERHHEPIPKPLGTQCNPSCPLFRCAKRALMVKLVNGKPVAWCSWVNDVCIIHKCQYASCTARYLLPDGRCLAALKTSDKGEDEFMRELEKRETRESLKSLLSRRGLRKDLGIEEL